MQSKEAYQKIRSGYACHERKQRNCIIGSKVLALVNQPWPRRPSGWSSISKG